MTTAALKSREFTEFIVTVVTAFVFVWFYKSSPILITCASIGMILACVTALKRPEYGVLFLAAILPFRDMHIVSAVSLKRAALWGLVFYLAIRQFTARQDHATPTFRRFNRYLLFFAAMTILSLIKTATEAYTTELITSDTLKTVVLSEALPVFEGILLCYIVYYSMNTMRQLQYILDLTMAVSGVISFFGILQYFIGDTPPGLKMLFDPEYQFYGRATSVFSNPNELGAFCAPMVAIALVSLILGGIPFWKKLCLLLPSLALNTAALLLSFSRGAVIQVFLGIVVTGYLYYIKMRKLSLRTVVFIGIIGSLMFSAVWYYDFYMQYRFGTYKGAEYYRALEWTKTVGDYQRKYAALKAMQSFIQHPIFGIGYDLFSRKKVAGFEYFGLATHNQYLKFLVEMGILGCIPFLVLLGLTFKTAMKMCELLEKRHTNSPEASVPFLLIAGMTPILVGYFFANTGAFLPISGFLWLFAGAVLTIERLYTTT